ncbi:hypothetical protein [Nocardia farcinica]|uniref:hypothetical protein n=1 Tax=Nocardia farcinica TaxID=37329 RepID=UPI0018931FB0|nr:hypothetical protein [Nocardia farcinica]MBF6187594.1 hypothetical protein [Nocardia farcinica]MBF6254464.1 hypothetical protein [Nocardia farcinica]MBF6373897.1 hypothetical protein [Nocardia farcinica]MBF6411007.1 hypothetical protein [Nocardia farcinica]
MTARRTFSPEVEASLERQLRRFKDRDLDEAIRLFVTYSRAHRKQDFRQETAA